MKILLGHPIRETQNYNVYELSRRDLHQMLGAIGSMIDSMRKLDRNVAPMWVPKYGFSGNALIIDHLSRAEEIQLKDQQIDELQKRVAELEMELDSYSNQI